MNEKPSLTLKRRIKAPRSAVYAAWTNPSMMMRWWAPEGIDTVHAESDPRIGGRFRVQMLDGASGEQHDVSGTFLDVVPDEKLMFTWAWRTMPERESRVTVTLKDEGDATLLTLFHEQFADEEARDGHKDGWSTALNKLERLFV